MYVQQHRPNMVTNNQIEGELTSSIAYIKELNDKIKALETKNNELEHRKARSAKESERQKAKNTPVEVTDHQHDHDEEQDEVKKPHFVASFQRFCTNCGKENDKFKPSEANCPNCKVPLGSKEEAKAAKVCWNCGKDPNAKVEVVCKDCKTPLGTKEEAEKLESCPTCHSKHAELVK